MLSAIRAAIARSVSTMYFKMYSGDHAGIVRGSLFSFKDQFWQVANRLD